MIFSHFERLNENSRKSMKIKKTVYLFTTQGPKNENNLTDFWSLERCITDNCRAVLDFIPDIQFPLFRCISHLLRYFIPGDR